MAFLIEILKSVVLGVVEGITEWLPISSTGHMILVDQFLQLNVSESFKSFFMVVIQLGAVLAVVVIYWHKLNPIKRVNGALTVEKQTIDMWMKIVIACVPAAIIGILFDDVFEALFYNPISIAIMLILFGVLFIVVENMHIKTTTTKISDITYRSAIIIGLFQVVAAVFPGTSRSGATIVGALLIGISRFVATEFTFFMSVPVMFGASLLKIVKLGLAFTAQEYVILVVGCFVSFAVSIVAIRFLLGYIKKNDFKAFGWYRIALGLVVLAYFLPRMM